jgi:tetratricopeptide (TPR) repeat protein
MVKNYFILLVFLPFLSFANNNEVANLFKKGNDAYAKADYKESITFYTKVINEGFESADLYYNLGNAYYKTEEIPSAILYYEKALKLNPADEDITVNLRFANLKTSDKIPEKPSFFLEDWWKSILFLFSLQTFTILSVVFIILSAVSLILFLYNRQVVLRKSFFYIALSLFFLGLISVYLSVKQYNYFNSNEQAILFDQVITAKSEPKDQSKDLFVIHAGTKVIIKEKHENWIKITLTNGTEGWISPLDLREI